MFTERSVCMTAVIVFVPGCFYFPFLQIGIFFAASTLSVLFLGPFLQFCCFCKGINALFATYFLEKEGCLNLLNYIMSRNRKLRLLQCSFLHSNAENCVSSFKIHFNSPFIKKSFFHMRYFSSEAIPCYSNFRSQIIMGPSDQASH